MDFSQYATFGSDEDEDDNQEQGQEQYRKDVAYAEESEAEQEDQEESDTEQHRELIRSQLANVPFEQLASVKHKMSADSESGPGISYHVPVKYQQKYRQQSSENTPPTSSVATNHRTSKNKPMEQSTKRAVSRFREVIATPSTKSRDPRFDPLCGTLNPAHFDTKYAFIDEYKKSEMQMLQDKIGAEKDLVEKKRLQMLVSRLTSQQHAKQQTTHRKSLERTWKHREMDLVRKTGKKPYYLKDSDKKKLEMIDKFEKVKEGKSAEQVEKVLEKRRKRNATRDITRLPYARKS